MKRSTVRIAAIVLAAGISISELAAVGFVADYANGADEVAVVLPRVVVTPEGTRVGQPGETLARAAAFPPRQ